MDAVRLGAAFSDQSSQVAWVFFALAVVIGVGGALAAIIMNRSPAVPVLIAFALVVFGLLVTFWA